MNHKIKFYAFAPHPVFYHAGIYRALAKSELYTFKVYYEDKIGLEPVFVKEFNKTIEWDVDLLDGYEYEFLKNYSNKPLGGFFSRVNFGIVGTFINDKPDIVMFHGYVKFSDWLIFVMSKLTGAKIIFRGEAVIKGDESSAHWKQRLKRFVLKLFLKSCDVVLYSCTGNKDYWKFYDVTEDKMFPIPCAVDNVFFREARSKCLKKRIQIKDELGIDEKDFVILFSARFTTRKRPFDLLIAVSKIRNNDITILFVGDGPERVGMERFVREHDIKAVFVGFKNQSEISKYYSIADLDIVISDYDPSPKALNEAMNFELPIIVTDVVGTAHDLVVDGVNGYIVKVGDINTIIEKITFLNVNREIAKKMGRRSSEIVDAYTFEKDAFWVGEALEYALEIK